jgi:hypothetical protein
MVMPNDAVHHLESRARRLMRRGGRRRARPVRRNRSRPSTEPRHLDIRADRDLRTIARTLVLQLALDRFVQLGVRASVGSSRSMFSVYSSRSFGAVASLASAFSVGSLASVGSAGSLLSIGSAGSILSIGSSGSILSIGSAGSFLSLGGRPTRRVEPVREDAAVRQLTGMMALAAIAAAATDTLRRVPA